MNLDILFNIFNNLDNNDDSGSYTDENSLLVDFSEHPLYWISGFNKVIDNYTFFKKYTVNTYKNINPDIDINNLEKAGEELMYRKAWEYIKNFDASNPFHLECLKIKASKELINNAQRSISFFEPLEEYEKCFVLKNLETKAKEFLK